MARYGVLWDMDGVLADTADLHYETWAQTLNEHGIRYTRAEFDTHFGQNNTRTLELIFGRPVPPEVVAEIGGRKEVLFRALVPQRVRVLPGVRAWLERLQAAGVPQAVASSAPQANIDLLVESLGLEGYFAALVGGAELAGKPDPAVFLLAAERIGLPPARCIVVEDSVHGVAAARRAGMACIAVATTTPAEALAAADLVIERLNHLPADAFDRLAGAG